MKPSKKLLSDSKTLASLLAQYEKETYGTTTFFTPTFHSDDGDLVVRFHDPMTRPVFTILKENVAKCVAYMMELLYNSADYVGALNDLYAPYSDVKIVAIRRSKKYSEPFWFTFELSNGVQHMETGLSYLFCELCLSMRDDAGKPFLDYDGSSYVWSEIIDHTAKKLAGKNLRLAGGLCKHPEKPYVFGNVIFDTYGENYRDKN